MLQKLTKKSNEGSVTQYKCGGVAFVGQYK